MPIFTTQFERRLMFEIDASARSVKLARFNLGGIAGVSGGTGGPPGGFDGQLAQRNITFDTQELTTSGIPADSSLVHNLNRIRGGFALGDRSIQPRHLASGVTFSGLTVQLDDIHTVGDENSNFTTIQLAVTETIGAPNESGLFVTPGVYNETVTHDDITGTKLYMVAGLQHTVDVNPDAGTALTLSGDSTILDGITLTSQDASPVILIDSQRGAAEHYFFDIRSQHLGGEGFAVDSRLSTSTVAFFDSLLFGHATVNDAELINTQLTGKLHTAGDVVIRGGFLGSGIVVGSGSHVKLRGVPHIMDTVVVSGLIDGSYINSGGDIIFPGGGRTTKADAVMIQGRNVTETLPTDTQVLAWNNSNERWEPSDQSGIGTLANIPVSTYSTIQEMHDIFHSAGFVSNGAVTDGGSNTVDVAAGTGLIRATDSGVAELLFFDWPLVTGLSVPADTIRYVVVEYNGGTPQATVKTTDDADNRTTFALATVVAEGSTLHITFNPDQVGDHAQLMIERSYRTMPLSRDVRAGGIILNETGTRNVTVSLGTLWDRLNPFPISAINTSSGDDFDIYYRDGGGDWTKVSAATQWPNTAYDDGDGVLGSTNPNRYASLWFYIEADGELVMLYGQTSNSTLAAALEEAPPSSIPLRLQAHGKLIGRILFQHNDATAQTIQSAFTDVFNFVDVGSANLADPTASIGLTVVDGVASTGMRSDAAPPLDVGIIPTWTAAHRFEDTVNIEGTLNLGIDDTTQGLLGIYGSGAGSNEGGQINLYLAADHDTTFGRWNIDVFTDDLRIFRSDVVVVNIFTAEGQLQLPTSGSGAGLLLGGDALLYRVSANILRTPDSLTVDTDIEVTNGDINIAGGVLKVAGTERINNSGGALFTTIFNSALTATRVTYAKASGELTDDANFVYTTGTGELALATSGSGAGLLLGGDAKLYRVSANTLRTPDALIVDTSILIGDAASPAASVILTIAGLTLFKQDGAGVKTATNFYNPDTTAHNGMAFSGTSDTTGVGASAGEIFAVIQFRNAVHDHPTRSGAIDFRTVRSGTLTTEVVIADGMKVGAATGGNKGVGTGNFAGDVYKNNTAYTNPDFVLEHFFTGKIIKYSDRDGAKEYTGLMPLIELHDYIQEYHRLPRITDESTGIFERGDIALEKIEELTLYILQQNRRIEILEGK